MTDRTQFALIKDDAFWSTREFGTQPFPAPEQDLFGAPPLGNSVEWEGLEGVSVQKIVRPVSAPPNPDDGRRCAQLAPTRGMTDVEIDAARLQAKDIA